MSALRRADPRVKVLATVAALAVALGARRPAAPLLVAGAALASYLASGEPRRALGRLAAAVALGAGLPLLLVTFLDGGHAAAAAGARVLGASAAGFWLVATTPLVELEAALVALGVPVALVELAALAHRSAAVLGATLSTGREAQLLRLGWRGARRGVRSSGVLAGLLVRRAVDRADALGVAMRMRGYRGRVHLPRPRPLTASDGAFAAASALALFAAACLGWSAR
jgi:energy-coupling factor transporter transmembrane protein EcfT